MVERNNKMTIYEVRRLADEWDMPFNELMSQMHTASADEIREYGV